MTRKTLLTSKEIDIILHRLACQLIENHNDFSDTILIGLQPRGSFLAQRLERILMEYYHINHLKSGLLDITFYRDDFRRKNELLEATPTKIDFLIENKKVVIIDDVLYSGRSVRAALTALQAYGRPDSIELLVLIDRRFSRHLPIQPDYRGRQVDAINKERVVVHWKETHNKDEIYLVSKQSKINS